MKTMLLVNETSGNAMREGDQTMSEKAKGIQLEDEIKLTIPPPPASRSETMVVSAIVDVSYLLISGLVREIMWHPANHVCRSSDRL